MDARQALQFRDEAEAYRCVERQLWPRGPVCPKCGGARVGKMAGTSTRFGTYKCYRCRKPFTVKIGTLFESSHVPMHKWLRAIYLLSSSRRGVASNQLGRILGVSPKTAAFMAERIAKAALSTGSTEWREDEGTWMIALHSQPNAPEVHPE
jgi:transposase-like protein